MLLKGKKILITGAARGIGRTMALMMSDEGADLGLVDQNPSVEKTAEEVRKKGGRVVAEVLDIAEPNQVDQGVKKLQEKLGGLNVLINNAGIVNNIAPITKMTYEAWVREISVNLTGSFIMIKAVLGYMIDEQWGRIINFSSLGATGGLHNQCGYAASKAGILGLTRTLAIEQGRNGITCNAIVPGLIETELVLSMPEVIKQGALANTPARRIGTMEEVGNLVIFLASDRSGYINGEEIHIDGGMKLNVSSLGSQKEVKTRFKS